MTWQPNIGAALLFIASCMIGVILIEIRAARIRMQRDMDSNVTALDLTQNAMSRKRGGDQANSDNREQAKIQHKAPPLMPG
jgi:hypothetical protein